MKNWIPITLQDIESHLLPGQLKALQDALKSRGLTDPSETVIQEVCELIRSFLSQHADFDTTPHTLPAHLKPVACHLILDHLSSRLPGLVLSDTQIRHAKEARLLLAQLPKFKAICTSAIIHKSRMPHITRQCLSSF